MDFISLSQPPLHVVPLFYEHATENSKIFRGLNNQSGRYQIPYWLNLQFVSVNKTGGYEGNFDRRFPGVIQGRDKTFLPFPFAEILQRHVDSLKIIDPSSQGDSASLDNISQGIEGDVFGCNHRAAVILRMLSIPQALAKSLLSVKHYDNIADSRRGVIIHKYLIPSMKIHSVLGMCSGLVNGLGTHRISR